MAVLGSLCASLGLWCICGFIFSRLPPTAAWSLLLTNHQRAFPMPGRAASSWKRHWPRRVSGVPLASTTSASARCWLASPRARTGPSIPIAGSVGLLDTQGACLPACCQNSGHWCACVCTHVCMCRWRAGCQ